MICITKSFETIDMAISTPASWKAGPFYNLGADRHSAATPSCGCWGAKLGYPLVNIQIAIENGPVEIVDFPMNSMVDLSIVM